MDEERRDEGVQPDSPAMAFADEVHAALEGWRSRMIVAATGRSATTVARMATARAAADLKRLRGPADIDDGVRDYARRAASAVSKAAHEIERNRYSLEALFADLDRLDKIFRRATGRPEPEPESETETETEAETTLTEAPALGDAGGGADN